MIATGVIGCNFEDQVIGGTGLHPVAVQAARIAALRSASDHSFINARTDIFLKAPRTDHNAAMVEEALARGSAYADAGASGLFLPGLADEALIAQACAASTLPVNIMATPVVPPRARLAELGVARISHGP